MKAKCDNCGKTFSASELVPLEQTPNLSERVDPDGEIPVGECPDCGALVYAQASPAPRSWNELGRARRAHNDNYRAFGIRR